LLLGVKNDLENSSVEAIKPYTGMLLVVHSILMAVIENLAYPIQN
jgi:hypothetical protein